MLSRGMLFGSGLFVTLAWLIPVFKLKISPKELDSLTISTIADGKFRKIYKSLLFITAALISFSLYISYPILNARLLTVILFASALIFIFITLKTNYFVHTISAFIFYFCLSLFCALYTKSIFRLIPLILFLTLLIQIKLLKKGNGLSILLLVYLSWITFLIG